MNECGRFLWERLPNAGSEAELVNALLDEYEVDRETAALDVTEFLDSLRTLGIL